MTAPTRRLRRLILLALAFLAVPAGSVGSDAVEVTHLANEGFLLARGDTKVLIDALFPGIRCYSELPDDLRGDLAAGRAPFDGVDLALLPGWHLAESRWLPLVAEIRPARVAAMHLATPDAPSSWFGSAGSRAGRVNRIREHHPRVWIPEAPLESRTYPAQDEPRRQGE